MQHVEMSHSKRIRDKVSANIKKEFDSEPFYNKNFLKTKLKSYGDNATDFYDKKKFQM